MGNVNYMQVVPNTHFWTDLNQILTSIEHSPEELTRDYLKIGLNNSKNNGYELKQIINIEINELLRQFSHTSFLSVDEIIDYVDFVHFNLFDLKIRIQYTLHFGLNLKNKIKMERREVYERLDAERQYQDMRWTPRREANGTPDEEKAIAEWINYMEFHLAKAKEAVYFLNDNEALAEIRKVTALGVRCMELHGCPEREIPEELYDGE